MIRNKDSQNIPIPTRRFGRTEIQMPVLSLGGMRYQQSWSDLALDEISCNEQSHVENILEAAVSCGLHHVETARHYGTSERQLGLALQNVQDPKRILQIPIAHAEGRYYTDQKT